jgi:hypothetical protein
MTRLSTTDSGTPRRTAPGPGGQAIRARRWSCRRPAGRGRPKASARVPGTVDVGYHAAVTLPLAADRGGTARLVDRTGHPRPVRKALGAPTEQGQGVPGSCVRGDSRDGVAIQVLGLRKRYREFEAVRELDPTVWAGEILAFLGPTAQAKPRPWKCWRAAGTMTAVMPLSLAATPRTRRRAGRPGGRDPAGIRTRTRPAAEVPRNRGGPGPRGLCTGFLAAVAGRPLLDASVCLCT